jgi:hypothetical protein
MRPLKKAKEPLTDGAGQGLDQMQLLMDANGAKASFSSEKNRDDARKR